MWAFSIDLNDSGEAHSIGSLYRGDRTWDTKHICVGDEMEMSSHHEQGKDHTIHSGKFLRYQLCSLYPSETMKGREVGKKGQRVNFHSTVNCLSISSQEKLYKGCCYY